MALSKTTQDHNEIQQWAEARGAIPAEVASTESEGQTGILRLEFPKAKNANDSALKEISWDEFFEKFDASGLALVYQEQTAEGEQSNFNKLIYPEESQAKPAKKSSARKTPTQKPAAKAPAARKTTAGKKTTATKAPSRSTPAKKSAGTKSAKKAVALKSTKAPSKKAAAKKSPAAAKKTSAKKSAGKTASGTRSRSR